MASGGYKFRNKNKQKYNAYSNEVKKPKHVEYADKNEAYEYIKKLIENMQYSEALPEIVAFNLEYPNDEYGMYQYGKCLIKTGREQEGIEELEYLRRKAKKPTICVQAYGLLLSTYTVLNRMDKCEELISDAEKLNQSGAYFINKKGDKVPLMPDFELDMLKLTYYNNIGLKKEVTDILKKPCSGERNLANKYIFKLHNADSDYFRRNKSEIEKKLSEFDAKQLIGSSQIKELRLKLYRVCYDNENAYKYIARSIHQGVKNLIFSYEVCMELDKKEEAKEFLDMIDSMDSKRKSKLSQTQIKYFHGYEEEAFNDMKEMAPNNYDAAYILYNWSIKLDKTLEALEPLKQFIQNADKEKCSKKHYSSIAKRVIRIYIYNEMYAEAYQTFQRNISVFDSYEREEMGAYFARKINAPYTPDLRINSYCISQIRNYDFEQAILHITKHKYRDTSKLVHTVFTDDIPIYDLIGIISPYLIKENLYEIGVIDKYIIDCKDLNISENKLVIGTIGREKNIVFGFPSKKWVDFDNLELEKENESDSIESEKENESDNPKMLRKRLSQIDKFNQRYGNLK